jgi:hypothetical protein
VHEAQCIQRQFPAVLCLQHILDHAESGAVRAQPASVGNECLFRGVGHKEIYYELRDSFFDEANRTVSLDFGTVTCRIFWA